MGAEYDSEADAIAIRLAETVPGDSPPEGRRVHKRGIVTVAEGRPVDVEILYPGLGIDEPLESVADLFELDHLQQPPPGPWLIPAVIDGRG